MILRGLEVLNQVIHVYLISLTFILMFFCPIFHPHLLGSYFNAFNAIYNHNMMCHSDLALDKYWVTHGGYFRLSTTVVLGMGIIDGKFIFCYGISEESVDKTKFQLESTTTGRFMTDSIITLHLILVAHILIYFPLPLMIDPDRIKDPAIPQISFQLPSLLPLKILVVILPPLIIRHDSLSLF